MSTNMLPPHWRSERPPSDPLTTVVGGAQREAPFRRPTTGSDNQRDLRTRWTWWLSLANLVVAAVTVLLRRGSPLVLGLGAMILAELLLLAYFSAPARRGGR